MREFPYLFVFPRTESRASGRSSVDEKLQFNYFHSTSIRVHSGSALLAYMLLCVYSFGLTTATTSAQTASGTASTNVPVDAPFAQTLVDKAMAQHADIRELGIHAVPTGIPTTSLSPAIFVPRISVLNQQLMTARGNYDEKVIFRSTVCVVEYAHDCTD
jgi:hypothetical protein